MGKNQWHIVVFKAYMVAAFSFILGAFLLSCNPTKKAQRELDKAKQVLGANLTEAAKFCTDRFPPKVEYVKGDSVIVLDTLYVGGDVVFDTLVTKDTVYITKTLPPKVITKTILRVDTIKDSNPAALIAANATINKQITELAFKDKEIAELKKNAEGWEKKAKRRWWFLVLVVGLAGGWILRKQIPSVLGLVKGLFTKN